MRRFAAAPNAARHRKQERIVIENCARFSPELVGGFAKYGQRFGPNVEVKGVLLSVGIFGLTGLGSEWVAAHQAFHFADAAATSRIEPLEFGLGGGDASELAHRGPAEAARFEGMGDFGQVLKRPGNAKALFRDAGRVAEHALRVLCEVGEPEHSVHGRSMRHEQPASFVPVELGS